MKILKTCVNNTIKVRNLNPGDVFEDYLGNVYMVVRTTDYHGYTSCVSLASGKVEYISDSNRVTQLPNATLISDYKNI